MSRHEDKGWWEQNWKWATTCGCLGCVGVPLLLVAILGGGIFSILQQVKGNEAYVQAVALVAEDPQVIRRLGQPIDVGAPTNVHMSTTDGVELGNIEANVSGPEGSGRMLASGHKVDDTWVLDSVVIRFSDGVEIEILGTAAMTSSMGRLIATTVLALFSAGWVAPAFIAAELFRSGLRRLAVDNGLSRGETYFEDAERYLLVAAVWLAVAVGLWAFIGARRLLIPRPDSR